MDDRRFDNLARLLATPRSRRSVVRAAAGTAAAGLLAGLSAARPADAAKPSARAARKRCRADAECADGNACTTDHCRNHVCEHVPIAGCCSTDGQCQDLNGQCIAGVCAGNRCVPSRAADGTVCDDGNACTQTDTCQAGVCAGGNPVVCTASDPCHLAGTCDPATGTCSNLAKSDGTSCSDGSACTDTDTCQGGACTPGTTVVCPPADQCHEAGVCNPLTGGCEYALRSAGTPCDAGNPCTEGDACDGGGACVAGSAVDCDDNNPCTVDTCDPATGCVHAPIENCCRDVGDCSVLDEPCAVAICWDNRCGIGPADDGTPCGDGDAVCCWWICSSCPAGMQLCCGGLFASCCEGYCSGNGQCCTGPACNA